MGLVVFLLVFMVDAASSPRPQVQGLSHPIQAPADAAGTPRLPWRQDAASPLPPERTAALEKAISTLFKAGVPTPLYKGSSHWGETTSTANGVKWVGKGLLKKPVLQYAQKNHGTWRKYEVELLETVPEPLKVRLTNAIVEPANHTLTFDLRLDADVRFRIDQENWNHGIKLFDGTARGTLHFTLVMKCESKLVIESGSSFLPVIKYRFRVVQATPSYSHLKFTHIPGLGGDAAEVLGKWAHEALGQLKPSVERKAIDKLTQKLLKAADTKEVQISLAGVKKGGRR
jgi:hypothetical protein